ncbi:hypothetical protein BGZ60DRAFT_394753 [Tricladium varicosporioides]|nr:hypothetical protein BGZ60DRAFT_394753 [Hymenoscyphus varicosporioides]
MLSHDKNSCQAQYLLTIRTMGQPCSENTSPPSYEAPLLIPSIKSTVAASTTLIHQIKSLNTQQLRKVDPIPLEQLVDLSSKCSSLNYNLTFLHVECMGKSPEFWTAGREAILLTFQGMCDSSTMVLEGASARLTENEHEHVLSEYSGILADLMEHNANVMNLIAHIRRYVEMNERDAFKWDLLLTSGSYAAIPESKFESYKTQ